LACTGAAKIAAAPKTAPINAFAAVVRFTFTSKLL
jgi:hypothetical protein